MAGIIVFILAAVTIISVTGAPSESFWPTYSTFYTDRFGTHAFFRLLRTLEYNPQKNHTALNEIEDQGFNNYVFIGPRENFDGEERDSLLQYIKRGSYALCSPQRSNNFLEDAGIELKKSNDEKRFLRGSIDVVPATIDPVFEEVKNIRYARKEDPESYLNRKMNSDFSYHLTSDSAALMPLLEHDGEVHAGYVQWGEGRIYLFSNPYIFLNEGLKQEQNAILAVAMIERILDEHPSAGDPRTIIFDEYYHGFAKDPVSSPFNVPEVRWMTWALLFSFVLLIVSFARRSAQPVPVLREPRRTIQEYISSLAHLYLKQDSSYFVYKEIEERFLKRLRQSLGYVNLKGLPEMIEVLEKAENRWGSQARFELQWILEKVGKIGKMDKSFTYFGVVNRMRKFSIKYKLD